jgi:hypothetical protein
MKVYFPFDDVLLNNIYTLSPTLWNVESWKVLAKRFNDFYPEKYASI